MNVYGYVRVSSRDQNEDRQLIALRGKGVEDRFIYMDGAFVFALAKACVIPSIKASPPLSRRTVMVCSPLSSTKHLAKSVLPKPGSPYSSSPWGRRAPISS